MKLLETTDESWLSIRAKEYGDFIIEDSIRISAWTPADSCPIASILKASF
jgi:hypothetical protein